MSIVGSLGGGESDLSSSENSSSEEDNNELEDDIRGGEDEDDEEEVEVEIDEAAAAKLVGSHKEAQGLGNAWSDAPEAPKAVVLAGRSNAAPSIHSSENPSQAIAQSDDIFGITFMSSRSSASVANPVSEDTPWTREYDREVVNAGDNDLLTTLTQGESIKDEEFEFDIGDTRDGNFSDDICASDDPSAIPSSESEIMARKLQQQSQQKADEKILIETMKASVAASLGEFSNTKSDSSPVDPPVDDVRQTFDEAAKRVAREYAAKSNDTLSLDAGETGEVSKRSESDIPSIRLSITGSQSLALESLVEEEEEDEDEDENEYLQNDQGTDIWQNNGNNEVKVQGTPSASGEAPEEEGSALTGSKENENETITMSVDVLEREKLLDEFDAMTNLALTRASAPHNDLSEAPISYANALSALSTAARASNFPEQTLSKHGICCFSSCPEWLRKEKQLFLWMSKIGFDGSSQLHADILLAGFWCLERSRPSLRSEKWMNIGFQGADPATDIRGTGMLGVLQFLFFVEKHHNLAAQVHALSRKEGNSFPLAVTGFHFTLACMRGLRAGVFDRVLIHKSEEGIFTTLAQIYAAMFLRFFRGWKVRSYKNRIESIQNFNPFKDEVIGYMLSRPARALTLIKSFVAKS